MFPSLVPVGQLWFTPARRHCSALGDDSRVADTGASARMRTMAAVAMEGWSCPVPPPERGDGHPGRRAGHIPAVPGRRRPPERRPGHPDGLPRRRASPLPRRVDDIAVAGYGRVRALSTASVSSSISYGLRLPRWWGSSGAPNGSCDPCDLAFGIQSRVDEHSRGGVALVSNTGADNVTHRALE